MYNRLYICVCCIGWRAESQCLERPLRRSRCGPAGGGGAGAGEPGGGTGTVQAGL